MPAAAPSIRRSGSIGSTYPSDSSRIILTVISMLRPSPKSLRAAKVKRAAAEAAMTAVSRYLYPFLIMFTHLYVRIQLVSGSGHAAAYAVDQYPLSVL